MLNAYTYWYLRSRSRSRRAGSCNKQTIYLVHFAPTSPVRWVWYDVFVGSVERMENVIGRKCDIHVQAKHVIIFSFYGVITGQTRVGKGDEQGM